MKKAYFAGGCFWCITPVFAEKEGVKDVISGYCGGDEVNPKYEDVKAQRTNHRETICIEYDENLISYKELLDIYFDNVDLKDDGGQFIDRGHSYTLAIYYCDEDEKELIEKKISTYDFKVCVALEKFKVFYDAEEYHQNYYLKNPEAFEEELVNSGRKNIDEVN